MAPKVAAVFEGGIAAVFAPSYIHFFGELQNLRTR